MPKKISRDICLIKYRKFPLRHYDKECDDEISFYPEIFYHYWLKLKSNEVLDDVISAQIVKLYENLNVEYLIFFGDYNRSWISKFTKERLDYKPLIDSVNYFSKCKISNRFNGGLMVKKAELKEFIKHMFVLTRCDGGFVYYHFLDENQNILGLMHYSGEVCFDILREETNELFLKAVKKTEFLDAFNENTNRI